LTTVKAAAPRCAHGYVMDNGTQTEYGGVAIEGRGMNDEWLDEELERVGNAGVTGAWIVGGAVLALLVLLAVIA